MISRERLRQADKHALRRWRVFHSNRWAGATATPDCRDAWQHYRKVTKPCSCWMCGHQRKSFGLTYQERRAQIVEEEGEW